MTRFDYLRGQPLSTRELQVVELVARGKTNPQIGAELDLASATIKQHMVRIAAKLGTGDRAGIVGIAIRRGLLQVPVTRRIPAGFDEALFDVLVRMARGLSNQEIGLELNLSCESVKSRARKLFAVLGVGSREEAVAVGVACGALPLVPARRRERVAA